MPTFSGHVSKMGVTHSDPVSYELRLDDQRIELNPYIGQRIKMQFAGAIECVHCSRKIKKSYNQGYCFPCSQRLAQCDMCIVRPHTCHYHLGTCREPEWGETHCLQPHVVYLANSSGVKVGITRREQIPTRWIDQGARHALPIVAASSRRLSGLLEVAIGQHVSDRTDWRKMLRGDPEPIDLVQRRDEYLSACETELAELRAEFGQDSFAVISDAEPVDISYPVQEYPTKVRSLNFDKLPEIEATLLGIKGQYLILDQGVLNMRRHGGYHLSVTVGD